MLRRHEIFEHPLSINLSSQVVVETPDAWKDDLEEQTIKVLPLVEDVKRRYPDGWCTYTYEQVQAPELEIICGGVNAKTPKASAIWRQGNLLHFGFEQSPADLNKNGRALLTNSICYIARFTEDRPLVRTPSPFYSKLRLLDRGAMDRLVKSDRELNSYLDWYLGGETRNAVRGMSRKELSDWYQDQRGFLHADERGKFVVDLQARAFAVAVDSEEFIPAAVNAWEVGGDRAKLAQDLLKRYVADALQQKTAQEWKRWWKDNRDYLFFTDTGGFVWQLDPLAKERKVPSKDLRGPERASRKRIHNPNRD